MNESIAHQQLVHLLLENIKLIIPQDLWVFICVDFAEYNDPPQMADGFRPDVYYQYRSTLIIGEAKTSNDVERMHSREQYKAYANKCSLFIGQAYLLVAVPWTEFATARNILRRTKNDYPGDYEIRVIEGFGRAI